MFSSDQTLTIHAAPAHASAATTAPSGRCEFAWTSFVRSCVAIRPVAEWWSGRKDQTANDEISKVWDVWDSTRSLVRQWAHQHIFGSSIDWPLLSLRHGWILLDKTFLKSCSKNPFKEYRKSKDTLLSKLQFSFSLCFLQYQCYEEYIYEWLEKIGTFQK